MIFKFVLSNFLIYKSPMKYIHLSTLLFFFSFSIPVDAELVFLKQNSAPKYFDLEAKKPGLCDLIYDEMKTRLLKQGVAVSIRPELFPIKRILAMITADEGHVYCGAGRNKKREKLFYYSKYPVYHPSNVLVMHQDDNFIAKDYSDLQKSSFPVGAFFGASSTSFLKSFEGIRVADHFTELSDGLNAVSEKKIPYFYYHDLGLTYLINQTTHPIKLMPTKFRTYDHWMLYSRSLSLQQINQLDSVVQSMLDDGTLSKFRRQFFK